LSARDDIAENAAALASALRIRLVVNAQKRCRIVPDVRRDGVNPVGFNRMAVSCPQQTAGDGKRRTKECGQTEPPPQRESGYGSLTPWRRGLLVHLALLSRGVSGGNRT